MNKTVSVMPIEGYPAWLLTWEQKVDKRDVAPAFRQLTQALDDSEGMIWVVVDLGKNPNLPLHETISSTLWGPSRHDKLRGWLVIGSNSTAQLIGRTLSKVTGRFNIQWFENMDQVLTHMQIVLDKEQSEIG